MVVQNYRVTEISVAAKYTALKKFTTSNCPFLQTILKGVFHYGVLKEMNKEVCTVFENHRKSRIQNCERSELRFHFE